MCRRYVCAKITSLPTGTRIQLATLNGLSHLLSSLKFKVQLHNYPPLHACVGVARQDAYWRSCNLRCMAYHCTLVRLGSRLV